MERSGFGDHEAFLLATFGVGAAWMSLALTSKSAESKGLAAVIRQRKDIYGQCGGLSALDARTPHPAPRTPHRPQYRLPCLFACIALHVAYDLRSAHGPRGARRLTG